MRKTDIAFLERRVERLDFQAPPMPPAETIFKHLVRLPELWTPHEYAYIQHFHKCVGNDPNTFTDFALDEWQYWHLLAVERYQMSKRERATAFAAIPKMRPYAWHFALHEPWRSMKKTPFCGLSHNEVPYDAPSMQQRGWHLVTVLGTMGFLWQLPAPFPHSIFVFMENEPDIIMKFGGISAFEDVMYYYENREKIHKKYKVRKIDGPLDFHFYEPVAGYSYRWEDGSLIVGSYRHGILQQVKESRAMRV